MQVPATLLCYFYSMYIDVLLVYISTHRVCAWCSWRPEEGILSGLGLTDSCELPCGFWESVFNQGAVFPAPKTTVFKICSLGSDLDTWELLKVAFTGPQGSPTEPETLGGGMA